MRLSLAQTKGAMRLLGGLEQLRQAAPSYANGSVLTPALHSVQSIRRQVLELFRDDLELLAELDRAMPAPKTWQSAPVAIAALEGWLRGLVDAERFEAQIRKNTKAWVEDENLGRAEETGFDPIS